MRELIFTMSNSGIKKQSPIKVTNWLDNYITKWKPNIQATTRAGYEEKIRTCIAPYIGKYQLQALNGEVMQDWVNRLVKEGKSPKTIRNAYNIVNSAMKKAKAERKISTNPCEGTELPNLVKYQAQVYDTNGIQKAIETAYGTDMYLIVLLLLTVGLRRGELCALKWEHIDFQNQVIHIRKNTVLANGEIVTKSPKSQSGIRDISIGKEVVDALKEAEREYFDRRKRMGAAFHDHGYIICKENGDQYRPDSITQKWGRFVEAKGLPHIRLHDLRHSNATALIQAGVSPKVVQERLGHSDVTTTLNIYTHVTPVMDRAAADTLDNLIFGDHGKDKASNE